MTTIESTRAAQIAAQFAESKDADKKAAIDGAARRRDLVLELLTMMKPADAGRLLGVSRARINQIATGTRGS